MGAIIAGTIKDIRETAVLPKSELQAESFPDTQPTSAPCQPQARGKRQLAMAAWTQFLCIRSVAFFI